MVNRSILALVTVAAFAMLPLWGVGQASVRVAPMDSVGPRLLEQQTRTAIVRDYIAAWQSMGHALENNRPELLNDSFVGLAREKLADTIRAQTSSKISTSYRGLSHDLKVVFYSPEGLSIQLTDDVEYDVEVRHGGQSFGTQHVKTHYVAVLSPTESKWKVRIFQSGN